MSLLYPRTIDVHRQRTNAVVGGDQQVGLVGYGGREQSTNSSDTIGETVLYTGIPATITPMTAGRIKKGDLPSDYTEKPQWKVSMPSTALPRYAIRDGDILVDDEGYRYGVTQNTWTILGYQVSCVRLEA